jgi:uncharacterized membrane protein YsdA (DUF1294 family)
MKLFLAFIGVMSLITFVAFGIDKLKAKRGSSRISERRLLLLSLIGGAAGAMCAMLLFRHKTQHLKFTLLEPLLLALHILIFIYIV